MAFGDKYGYKTNVDRVVAFAQGDEYQATVRGEEVTVVDLVLTGFASGTARRNRVPVATDEATAEVNQAFPVV